MVRIRETCARADRARCRVEPIVEEIDGAHMREAGLVREPDADRVRADRATAWIDALRTVAQIALLVAVEIDVHRILGHQCRQQRLICAGEIARRHESAADTPGDRSTYFGKAEIKL